jgi:hypothetical protein
MKPFRLSRRHLLRGTLRGCGYSVGLPLLEAMVGGSGSAFAQGAGLPKRFGVFFWGLGVYKPDWIPTQTGANWSVPPALTSVATPALKPYVTLVTGFNHRDANPGHIPGRGLAVSSSHNLTQTVDAKGNVTYREKAHPEPSVDHIIGQAIGGRWAGMSVSLKHGEPVGFVGGSSWGAGGTANAFDSTPVKLYQRLFSQVTPLDDSEKKYRTQALSAVKESANTLRTRLGSADKQRMERHLEALSELERELQGQAPAGQCSALAPGSDAYDDGKPTEKKAAKNKVMAKLLATGLACDAVRTFCYEFSPTRSDAVYWEVGETEGHHTVSHRQDAGAGVRKITPFIMSQLGVLLEEFRNTPDGPGNLLDHLLMLGTSEHSDPYRHDYNDHPYIFVGKGSRLKTGLHFRHSSPSSNFDAPQILLTAVRALGIERASLGQATGERATSLAIDQLLT